MWEARGNPDTHQELVAWACQAADDAEGDLACAGAEVFTSLDLRVVVISRWRVVPPPFPRPPSRLVSREPHAWDFAPVDR
jgi:hypothetical protein